MSSRFFPAWKEIMCNTGMPIICKIGGFNPDDGTLLWAEEIFMPCMPRGHMLDELAVEAYMIITRQIWVTYQTCEVPDNIVWVGRVLGSISPN